MVFYSPATYYSCSGFIRVCNNVAVECTDAGNFPFTGYFLLAGCRAAPSFPDIFWRPPLAQRWIQIQKPDDGPMGEDDARRTGTIPQTMATQASLGTLLLR